MARREITRDHLGVDATRQDVDNYNEAVRRLAAEQFDGDEEASDEYLWGNGDYGKRMPADLL